MSFSFETSETIGKKIFQFFFKNKFHIFLKQDSTFLKIFQVSNSQTNTEYFESFQVRSRLECFKKCNQNFLCREIKFSNETCET